LWRSGLTGRPDRRTTKENTKNNFDFSVYSGIHAETFNVKFHPCRKFAHHLGNRNRFNVKQILPRMKERERERETTRENFSILIYSR